MAKKDKTVSKEENSSVGADQKLSAFLHNTRKEHLNYLETIYYKVSTGSLLLDSRLNGGASPGIVRLVGHNNCGKTPEAFELLRNFFIAKPKSRGVYFKAEGRLSPENKARSGINFVEGNPEGKWVEGTCYVHETNVLENVLDFMNLFVDDQDNEHPYFFIVDSLDALIRRDDKTNKQYSEAQKVAGPQVVWKNFLKYLNLLQKRGHILVLISQVSSNVQIDPRSPAPVRLISGTGGNAALHWADIILDYQPQFPSDLILENPNLKLSADNKAIGHECKVVIKKAATETMHETIRIPIKHGRTNGSSIWREREIIDFFIASEYIIQKAAWFNFEESYLQELRSAGFEVEDKYQGLQSIYNLLESNKDLTDRLYQDCLTLMNAQNSSTFGKIEAKEIVDEK